jgi:dihydrolipoamide dehydrogenase
MTTTETRKVDVAVIGAGTAGLAAYRAAAAHTDRVVLIEAGPGGTTCARVGCMPSKLLIAAAEAAHHARSTGPFGVDVEGVRVDGRRVMDRVRRERDRFVGFVLDGVDALPAAHRIDGRARFLDAHTLEVDGADGRTRVEARAVVIATGSRPRLLPLFDGLGDRLLVNDDVFDWETLPRSVAVFGPGVVGLELGQALHRLGVRVRMFGVGGFLGPITDPEIRVHATRVFGAELPLDTDATVHALRREGDEVVVAFDEGGARVEERFEHVLAAVGRVPRVDGLGLERTGLPLDRLGVPVHDPATLRAGDSRVFVAGDVTGTLPVLHEAADEGRVAGENAARPEARPIARRAPLSIVFSDPQISIVGGGFAAARGRDPIVGRVSFENQGRSRVMRRNRGRLHVYADPKDGRFLGAEMLGPDAEHLGHLLAWAHQARLDVASMLAMPFYHPVVEEGLRTALRDAHRQLAGAPLRASA